MSNKLIITEKNNKNSTLKITSLICNDNITDIYVDSDDSCVGHVYVAAVRDMVKNINAAFVEYKKDTKAYMSLDTVPLYVNKKNTDKVCIGDYVIGQISKDSVKTKNAVFSPIIELSGKYCVLKYGKNNFISFSSKIPRNKEFNDFSENVKLQFSKLNYSNILDISSRIGFIIRTEAFSCNIADLYNEVQELVDSFEEIISRATCKVSSLYEDEDKYIKLIKEKDKNIDEIVTDRKLIFDKLSKLYPEKTRLYDDRLITITNIYGIDKAIEGALCKKVWLKSGGYLIIDYTEAMTVIDVNTGKYEAGKDASKTFKKINEEAAIEIAKQIRLRNLSGIIVIDFIDLFEENDKINLQNKVICLLKEDPVKAVFVDYTKLGLMEITRKKVRKPLYEVLKMD